MSSNSTSTQQSHEPKGGTPVTREYRRNLLETILASTIFGVLCANLFLAPTDRPIYSPSGQWHVIRGLINIRYSFDIPTYLATILGIELPFAAAFVFTSRASQHIESDPLSYFLKRSSLIVSLACSVLSWFTIFTLFSGPQHEFGKFYPVGLLGILVYLVCCTICAISPRSSLEREMRTTIDELTLEIKKIKEGFRFLGVGSQGYRRLPAWKREWRIFCRCLLVSLTSEGCVALILLVVSSRRLLLGSTRMQAFAGWPKEILKLASAYLFLSEMTAQLVIAHLRRLVIRKSLGRDGRWRRWARVVGRGVASLIPSVGCRALDNCRGNIRRWSAPKSVPTQLRGSSLAVNLDGVLRSSLCRQKIFTVIPVGVLIITLYRFGGLAVVPSVVIALIVCLPIIILPWVFETPKGISLMGSACMTFQLVQIRNRQWQVNYCLERLAARDNFGDLVMLGPWQWSGLNKPHLVKPARGLSSGGGCESER